MNHNFTKPEYLQACLVLLDMPASCSTQLDKLNKDTLARIYDGLIKNAKSMNLRAEDKNHADS